MGIAVSTALRSNLTVHVVAHLLNHGIITMYWNHKGLAHIGMQTRGFTESFQDSLDEC